MRTDARSGTAQLLARYDRPGPRYTSYPTAVEFHDGFTETDYRRHLALAAARRGDPLSLYVHLPFCEHRCLFCACNVVITRHREVAARYLDLVLRELALLAGCLGDRRTLAQMHWGGGTPTYYPPEDLETLFRAIAREFEFAPDADLGIEADPRVTSAEHVSRLAALGFNRLSLGVQDFDPEVQETVHRVQGPAETRALVESARAGGFTSVNLDLIFGLPHQTVPRFRRTLEQVLEIRPDRLAVYSFAFVPWLHGHMKRLPREAMPGPELKLELLALAIDLLTARGYRQIGMDHFALPTDSLARAAETGALHRNFMGYAVQPAPDLVGLGMSAIGDVAEAFMQNAKKLSRYEAAVSAGRLPTERGYALTEDDRRRRWVIIRLMGAFRVDGAAFERAFGVPFARCFSAELEALQGAGGLVEDSLLAIDGDTLIVTERGKAFVRSICMVFDSYLARRTSGPAPVFSRTV
jgi:oxygen-independent coproporphyrinogen-3 oxidase